MAVNKVVRSDGTTLIDLTGDTVTHASHIMSGRIGHLADGTQVTGTGQGSGTTVITVNDTSDSGGGTIRTITAVDISDTTAVASDVAQGKYFYNASGVKTAGTASGGPSVTAHTLYFEFSDNTDLTISAYWDGTFISDAIRATTPDTYSGKTVETASLDGVTWYTKPTEAWETLYESSETQLIDDTPYPYFWISSLADIEIPLGSTWRITWMNVVYTLTVTYTSSDYGGIIGNPKFANESDDGTDVPFGLHHTPWGAWSGGADETPGNYPMKIERLVTV